MAPNGTDGGRISPRHSVLHMKKKEPPGKQEACVPPAAAPRPPTHKKCIVSMFWHTADDFEHHSCWLPSISHLLFKIGGIHPFFFGFFLATAVALRARSALLPVSSDTLQSLLDHE